jgi:hypothetical protein
MVFGYPLNLNLVTDSRSEKLRCVSIWNGDFDQAPAIDNGNEAPGFARYIRS